jgi:hypothetical protein
MVLGGGWESRGYAHCHTVHQCAAHRAVAFGEQVQLLTLMRAARSED